MDEHQPIINPFDEDESKSRQPIVWVLLGIIAIGCGLLFAGAFFIFQPDAKSLYAQYFPSPTLTPSRTPTSTPTLTLTPTYTPTATNTQTPTPNMTATVQVQNAQSTAENALSNWKVILSDTFDSNENNWLIEEASDDEYALTSYQILDGKYQWASTSHKPFIGWVRTGSSQLDDFYVTVEARQASGPDSSDYGFVLREDEDSNFYYFGISDSGQYAFLLFFNNWSALRDWTDTSLIRPGEDNKITIIVQGSQFIFFINDQYLTEITNDKIPKGKVALAVELANENDQAVFEFDNLELRTP